MSVLEQCASDIIQENGMSFQHCVPCMDYMALQDRVPLCLCEGLCVGMRIGGVCLHTYMIMCVFVCMHMCRARPMCKCLFAFNGLQSSWDTGTD